MTSKDELIRALADYTEKTERASNERWQKAALVQQKILQKYNEIGMWLDGVKGVRVEFIPNASSMSVEQDKTTPLQGMVIHLVGKAVTFTPKVDGTDISFTIDGLLEGVELTLKQWGEEWNLYTKGDHKDSDFNEGSLLFKLKQLIPR